MAREISKIRAALDRLLDKKRTDNTVERWKLIAGTFKGMAEIIEENGYYPNITQQEAIINWMERYVNMERDNIKNGNY